MNNIPKEWEAIISKCQSWVFPLYEAPEFKSSNKKTVIKKDDALKAISEIVELEKRKWDKEVAIEIRGNEQVNILLTLQLAEKGDEMVRQQTLIEKTIDQYEKALAAKDDEIVRLKSKLSIP